MNSFIIWTCLLPSLLLTVHALNCANNPCQLDGYFAAINGYRCIQVGAAAYCTCPDGQHTVDTRCRICDRPGTCNTSALNFAACIESAEFGTTYACAFDDGSGTPIFTQDPNGNPTVTLTTRSTTTISTTTNAANDESCPNGGVVYNGFCNCPSGFGGPICAEQMPKELCNRINCTNGGYCIVRNYNGPLESSCTCKVPFFGEYCQIQGAVASCSSGYCNNGGACKEFIGGTTRYAFCECAAGYNGVRCENRYFTCPAAGNWVDYQMFAQGKYFQCTALFGGGFRITQKSCAKGLRFNMNADKCTL